MIGKFPGGFPSQRVSNAENVPYDDVIVTIWINQPRFKNNLNNLTNAFSIFLNSILRTRQNLKRFEYVQRYQIVQLYHDLLKNLLISCYLYSETCNKSLAPTNEYDSIMIDR